MKLEGVIRFTDEDIRVLVVRELERRLGLSVNPEDLWLGVSANRHSVEAILQTDRLQGLN